MPEVILTAQTGRTTGSSSSRRLRAEGQIPAVLYGHGMASLSISVDRRELRHALTGPAGVNALVNLEVDGVTHPTIVKSLQRDPLRAQRRPRRLHRGAAGRGDRDLGALPSPG